MLVSARQPQTSVIMKKRLCIYVLFLAVTSIAEEKNIDQILYDATNNFTAKMFYEVIKLIPDKSVVLSAFSVMPPLAQLALASVGESHDELLDSIGMPNDNITTAAFLSVNKQLRTIQGTTLKTASKIYIAKNYEINPEFAANARDNFGSDIQSINFLEKQKAAEAINSWVEEQTNHKIKNLVAPDNFNPNSRALLVNAIYFKGTWKNPFRKYNTIDRDFYVSKDNIVQIATMFGSGNYKYVNSKELQAQILEIPYEGDVASFIIILPQDVDGINELEKKLRNPAVLDKAIRNLEFTEVDVYIPKFQIKSTTNLKEILQKMRITKMFNAKTARLDNLLKGSNSLYIDSAIQKAFIEINEEGAEAAVANVFGSGLSLPMNPIVPQVFRADRPFYFSIKIYSLILFSGVFRE